MGKSNLQFLLWICLLFNHFPSFQSFHQRLCVGNVEPNGANSIGVGSDQYHNSPLSRVTTLFSNCFDTKETNANTLTPYYIFYKSTDFHDTTDEGNILLGWISVAVTVPNGFDQFAIQSTVPKAAVQFSPGEMVTTRLGGSCQENFGGQPVPKLNLAPCYFASDPSTTVAVGAAYNGSRLNNLRLTFRTEFTECAPMHEKTPFYFRFHANRYRNIDQNGNCTYPRFFSALQDMMYVKDINYGGYDPEPPRESGKISCGTSLNTAKGWVLKYADSSLNSRGYPEVSGQACYEARSNSLSFSGRCSYVNSKPILNPSNTYKCNTETPQKEGIPHVPENPPGGGACEGCQSARNRTRESGVACASTIGENIWGLRSTHGIAMAWTAMVVIPLSTLLARYYKETLMKYRYVNVHVWHGVHTATAFTGFAGLLSGWVAALTGRLYFGFSKNAVGYLHWTLGYVSILSFLVAFVGSSFRVFELQCRLRTICFHFLAGTITRICWTICLLTSLYIPGSPAASSDTHISGFTLEPAAAIIIPWIIVDVAVHVFLMVNLKSTDKNPRFSNARTYAICVPIPLIRPEEETDFPGAGLKKIALFVHTAVGILCASLLSVFICLTGIEGRFFGQMWYTHKDSGKLNMLMKETFYD